MVTGVGFCGRIGRRKRERQMRRLIETPEKFHFTMPPKKRNLKVIIISKDGKTIVQTR